MGTLLSLHFLIGMKLPKRKVLGVPRSITVIACVSVYACMCACVRVCACVRACARVCVCVCGCVSACVCVHVPVWSLVKGVPNSEHSINTRLISQQYILNSDELIFLVRE